MLGRLLDFLIPHRCPLCLRTLGSSEACLCPRCLMRLPFYLPLGDDLQPDFTGNEMARIFWVRLNVERAAALMHYHPEEDSALLITGPKYARRHDIAWAVGRLIATRFAPYGFFDDIDFILPMPTTPNREEARGMNHVQVMAEGLIHVLRQHKLHAPTLLADVVTRSRFEASQTSRSQLERNHSVTADDFTVVHPERIAARTDGLATHILLFDDVVTTGTSVTSLGQAVSRAVGGDIRFSILAVGRASIL